MHGRLEQLAEAGEWPAIGPLLAERDALIARQAGAERERALLAARRCTERLTALAAAARRECMAELRTLRHGRRAAMRYVTVRQD